MAGHAELERAIGSVEASTMRLEAPLDELRSALDRQSSAVRRGPDDGLRDDLPGDLVR